MREYRKFEPTYSSSESAVRSMTCDSRTSLVGVKTSSERVRSIVPRLNVEICDDCDDCDDGDDGDDCDDCDDCDEAQEATAKN